MINITVTPRQAFAIRHSLGKTDRRKRFGASPLSGIINDQIITQIPKEEWEILDIEWKSIGQIIAEEVLEKGRKNREKLIKESRQKKSPKPPKSQTTTRTWP